MSLASRASRASTYRCTTLRTAASSADGSLAAAVDVAAMQEVAARNRRRFMARLRGSDRWCPTIVAEGRHAGNWAWEEGTGTVPVPSLPFRSPHFLKFLGT